MLAEPLDARVLALRPVVEQGMEVTQEDLLVLKGGGGLGALASPLLRLHEHLEKSVDGRVGKRWLEGYDQGEEKNLRNARGEAPRVAHSSRWRRGRSSFLSGKPSSPAGFTDAIESRGGSGAGLARTVKPLRSSQYVNTVAYGGLPPLSAGIRARHAGGADRQRG